MAFWGPLLGLLTGGLSAIGQGQSQNRAQQNNFQSDQNRALASMYGTHQNALLSALGLESNEQQQNAGIDLNRRNFALNAPDTRTSQAVRGSILQSLQPASFSGGSSRLRAHTPTIEGGLSAANLGPGAREAGALLEQNALTGLRTGDNFNPLPTTNFRSGVMDPPNLPGFQGPGTLESILGIIGTMGGPLLESWRRSRGGNGTQYHPPGAGD